MWHLRKELTAGLRRLQELALTRLRWGHRLARLRRCHRLARLRHLGVDGESMEEEGQKQHRTLVHPS